MSTVAMPFAKSSRRCGMRSSEKIAVRVATSTAAPIARRLRSPRLNARAAGTTRWVSIACGSAGSGRLAVMSGEIGAGEGLSDELRDTPAVGAAPGSRREPTHDLAEVARVLGAGGGHGFVDELFGKVFAEDGDLGLLLGREILPVALPERVDGLAAGLHLAGDDGAHVVVGELASLALLDRVHGVLGHAQD